MRAKFLLVDDDDLLCTILKRVFIDDARVVIAKCHSKEEGLRAIEEHKPTVLFLDHSLTRGGQEGLEIADLFLPKGIEIYSTSEHTNPSILAEYEKRGISVIGKKNLERFKLIVAGH